MAKMISSSEVSKRMGVFTHDEVKERARYYHTEDKMDEIQLWYDGYLFGKIKIYLRMHLQRRWVWRAVR